jgi:hypothetical protein
MISAAGLYSAVKDALDTYNAGDYQNEKSNPQHMAKMAKAMKDYLEANAVFTYSWAGVMPPSVPDPVVSFTSTISFSSFTIVSPQTLSGLASQIVASVATGLLSTPDGFVLTPGTLLSLPLTLPSVSSPDGALKTCITDPVYAWFVTLINPTPRTGTHGSYTGSAVMTLIS